MSVLNEKEFLITNQQFAFKLRDLFLANRDLFNQLEEYLPYSIHVNNKETLDLIYCNDKLLSKGPEMVTLKEVGATYLDKISCPKLLNLAKKKAKQFKVNQDFNEVVSYPQHLQVSDKMTFFYSNKLHLNSEYFFNISNFMDDLGALGSVFNSIFIVLQKSNIDWQCFQSLTKREKEILDLLGQGHSTKVVSEQLFISERTVSTHRKNIYFKTRCKNIVELINFNLALKVLKF